MNTELINSNQQVITNTNDLIHGVVSAVMQNLNNSVTNEKKLYFDDAIKYEFERRKLHNHAKSTIYSWKSHMKVFYNFLVNNRNNNCLSDFTAKDAVNYGLYLRDLGYEGVGFNNHIGAISRLFDTLVGYGYLKSNVCKNILSKDIVPHRRKDILTLEQIKKIVLSFDISKKREFMGLVMFSIHVEIGCRACELLNLKIENINFNKGTIFYYAPKNKVEVHAHLTPLTLKIIKTYLNVVLAGKRKGKLFIAIKNDEVNFYKSTTYQQLSRIYDNIGLKANLPFRLCTHTVRRTVVTQILKNGGDLATAQKLVGHKDIRTTSLYVHYTDEDLKEKHEVHGLFNQIISNGKKV